MGQIARRQRDAQAARLAADGLSIAAIGREIGMVTPEAIKGAIRRGKRSNPSEEKPS